MQIAIYSQVIPEKGIEHLRTVFQELDHWGYRYSLYQPISEMVQDKVDVSKIPTFNSKEDLIEQGTDAMITLGGDGTILKAVTLIKDAGIPIIGINLGRLGFLAIVEKKMIARAIESIEKGKYTIQERTMIYLETNENIFSEERFALNDFTLHKRDTSSMITIHTFINGEFLNSYWADGLIVSTPTGSTGYSLSCGGPIIFPGSGNFVITPVAPHNLNVRPIVISDDSVISFQIEGRAETYLATLDSRYEAITTHHQLAVRKCHFNTKLLKLDDHNFMQTLRGKLAWGADVRN